MHIYLTFAPGIGNIIIVATQRHCSHLEQPGNKRSAIQTKEIEDVRIIRVYMTLVLMSTSCELPIAHVS